jgi:hypothetical protein
MRYYDRLAESTRDEFEVIVDKTYEDLHPRDCFDDSCYDITEMCQRIDSGQLDWFMLRVRVLVEGLEVGNSCLGGCLYDDAREVLTDGTAEDLIGEALDEARAKVYRLSRKFAELSNINLYEIWKECIDVR